MSTTQLANSVSGYVAKLKIRRNSRHTLLVEGDSDRTMLSPLIIRANRDPKLPPIVVDSAEIIKSPGLGNREIVEAVHSTAKAVGVGNYACIVDREFRSFNCTAPYRDDQPRHHVQDDVLFWTRGHSVENYLFTAESVIRYLEIDHAAVLPPDFRNVVRVNYDKVFVEALAFSLAAFGASLIKKSDGVVTLNSWKQDSSGNPQLDIVQIGDILKSRAASAASLSQLTVLLDTHRTDLLAAWPSFARWLTHGHLGMQIVWTGIGYLFSEYDIRTDILDQICRGQNDMKSKICADLWAGRCFEHSPDETPESLIKWLSGD